MHVRIWNAHLLQNNTTSEIEMSRSGNLSCIKTFVYLVIFCRIAKYHDMKMQEIEELGI